MKGKIFNAQEVQAIIAGNKTMFREVIKPQNILIDSSRHGSFEIENGILKTYHRLGGVWHLTGKLKCPYKVGQKIFCKEDFCEKVDQDTFEFLGSYHYRASCGFDVYMMDGDGWTMLNKDGSERLAWKPAQHMKQEHSRLTLLIKSIGVERLQDISEEDCQKEGMFFTDYGKKCYHQGYLDVNICPSTEGHKNQKAGWHHSENKSDTECWDRAVWAFRNQWNATHKKPEEKFEASPFVWVVTMEVVK